MGIAPSQILVQESKFIDSLGFCRGSILYIERKGSKWIYWKTFLMSLRQGSNYFVDELIVG